jgi:two-component system, NtrC family, response regulator
MKILVEYDWPGNVRELGNVLERASIKASDGIIQKEDVPVEIVAQAVSALAHEEKPRPLKDEVALAERRAIERALHYAKGSRTVTSELLGIHRSGLHQKMKRYGIDIK